MKWLGVAALAVLTGCPGLGPTPPAVDGGADAGTDAGTSLVDRTFTFDGTTAGWTHGFADLPVVPGPTYDLDGGLVSMGVPDHGMVHGYRLQSTNRSDDVCSYLRHV